MAARPSVLRAAFVAFSLASAGGAAAQVGAGLTLESDYRFRGVSLSGGQPDLHLNLAWDGANGAYAGAAATSVELERGPRRGQLIGYLGVARATGGVGWEVGASAAHFVAAAGYDYAELYAGLLAGGWNARLSFSPDYFGQGARTLYAELNADRALEAPWRVFAHLGALGAIGGAAASTRPRYDLRVGLGATYDAWDLQLAWVEAGSGDIYPTPYPAKRRGLVLSVARFF
jgi:uncharacterized protein (TIGR02001 family)